MLLRFLRVDDVLTHATCESLKHERAKGGSEPSGETFEPILDRVSLLCGHPNVDN
jgi:hypothetical protein